MRLKEIPQALRDWRTKLVTKWLRAKTQADRDALIPRTPKSQVRRNAFGKLFPDSTQRAKEAHAREIEAKRAETAALAQELLDANMQLDVLRAEADASKKRTAALRRRHEEIIRDQNTVPARALEIVQSLGFDVSSRDELYSNQKTNLRNKHE